MISEEKNVGIKKIMERDRDKPEMIIIECDFFIK